MNGLFYHLCIVLSMGIPPEAAIKPWNVARRFACLVQIGLLALLACGGACEREQVPGMELSRRHIQESFRKTEHHTFDADATPSLPTLSDERWKKYVAICATSRDDFLTDLEEWIEYHLRIGVDVVYFIDHHSKVPKFNGLVDYIRRSEVVYHFLETPIADQMYVYEFCVHTYGNRHRWMGFIDTDEFVVIPSGQNIHRVLNGYEDYPGVSLSWRYYGSSGQEKRPAKGVLKTYSACRKSGEKLVKTFANPAMIRQITNAHFQHYVHNARAVNVRKEEIDGPWQWPPLMETMYINHYFLKSLEDWQVKIERWKGWYKAFPNRTELQ